MSKPQRARWWRDPLLHFVLLGGVLFALDAASPAASAAAEAEAPTVTVTAEHVRELEHALRASGKVPTPAEVDAQVQRYVDEEVMVREARRLGLDRGDLIIRRRLMQKMNFLIDDMAKTEPPSDAALAEWFAAHRDRYRRPARYDVQHVFFSRERRGAGAEDDAKAALAQWRDDHSEPTGDPFLGGAVLKQRTADQLRRGFGKTFAAAAEAAQPGLAAGWIGPVVSRYGHHLIRVVSRTAAEDPPLDAVRRRVRDDLLEARRRVASGKARADLRARYRVVVEPSP